jgi:hypothetical protein
LTDIDYETKVLQSSNKLAGLFTVRQEILASEITFRN